MSPTSYAARSPFVVPEDRRNLNRSFPGDPDGSFTDALAHHLFTEFIAPSDLLIDLHAGDMVEALEPFVLYDDSPRRQTAERLARAFGFGYVVCDTTDALSGSTSAAAAAAGIPAVIAEAGGCGLLEPAAVELHVRGLQNALRAVGMLPGEPEPPPPDQRLVERFVWLRSASGGWWQADVGAGDASRRGRSPRRDPRPVRRRARDDHRAGTRRGPVPHHEPGGCAGRPAARPRWWYAALQLEPKNSLI